MRDRFYTVETCGYVREIPSDLADWCIPGPSEVVLTTSDMFEALREFDERSRRLHDVFDSEYRTGSGRDALWNRGYAVMLWQHGGSLPPDLDPELLVRETYDMRDYVVGIRCPHSAELYEDTAGKLHMFSFVNGDPVWAGVYGIGDVASAAADWVALTDGDDLRDWECAYGDVPAMQVAYRQLTSPAQGKSAAVKIGDKLWRAVMPHALDMDALGSTGKAMARVAEVCFQE